jgi:hypothetical protein
LISNLGLLGGNNERKVTITSAGKKGNGDS